MSTLWYSRRMEVYTQLVTITKQATRSQWRHTEDLITTKWDGSS